LPEKSGKPSRIAPLGDFDDREVAAEDSDVRGWDVIAADGERMGVVDELLIDTGTGRVRYLEVDLEDDLVEAATRNAGASAGKAQAPSQKIERQIGTPAAFDDEGGARHVLLPIARIRIDKGVEQVFLEGMGSREAAALPEYRPGASLPALERALAERFAKTGYTGNTGNTGDTGESAAEERFWRRGGAADVGTASPEPGTTPAELEADEIDPAPAPGGSRRTT
jgi:sporulation protein YlmC with PRC-barrel domain